MTNVTSDVFACLLYTGSMRSTRLLQSPCTSARQHPVQRKFRVRLCARARARMYNTHTHTHTLRSLGVGCVCVCICKTHIHTQTLRSQGVRQPECGLKGGGGGGVGLAGVRKMDTEMPFLSILSCNNNKNSEMSVSQAYLPCQVTIC